MQLYDFYKRSVTSNATLRSRCRMFGKNAKTCRWFLQAVMVVGLGVSNRCNRVRG